VWGSNAVTQALDSRVWLDRCATYGAVAGRKGDMGKYYARGFPDVCQYLVEEAAGVDSTQAQALVAASGARDPKIAELTKITQASALCETPIGR